jgi:hypothetical protein
MGDRDYALASDLVRIRPEFHLIDRTNNHIIHIDTDEDAYANLIVADLEQDDTGLPSIAAIDPTSREIFFDRAPTAEHNAKVFTYFYEADTGLSTASANFPFSEPVYRAVVEAAQQKYEKLSSRDFDQRSYNSALARAASRLSALPRRDTWDTPGFENVTDPFEHSA